MTFLGIFITAFIGVALMKRQGASVVRNWQASLSKGELNTSSLSNGVSLILGAILMLLPAMSLILLVCSVLYQVYGF